MSRRRAASVPPGSTLRRLTPAVVLLVSLAWVAGGGQADLPLGEPEIVAEGISLFRLDDPRLLDPPGPIAVYLLRLDPSRVELQSALAGEQSWATDTVQRMAERQQAAAAINGGFFEPSGTPAGVLKMAGRELSVDSRPRGALGIAGPDPTAPARLLFDRVTIEASAIFRVDGRNHTAPIAGIDTTRLRGRLMLYTPRSGRDTGTAPAGTEWILAGSPLRVTRRQVGRGKSRIPSDGVVLSFGGTIAPPPLDRLSAGSEVAIVYQYRTEFGSSPAAWASARDITGGAGLLLVGNRLLDDWAPERFTRRGFTTDRHPRTLVGVGPHDEIWMAAVDGRQPNRSLGMSFEELQRLAQALKLRDALNLDGGGSTTMVVGNRTVNQPSDPAGPRRVSDALLVFARGRVSP